MPITKKFSKIKRAMEKEYGKSKGTKIAYAYAKKHNLKTDRKK